MALEGASLPAGALSSSARAALDSRQRQLKIALAPCGPRVARAIYASLANMAARALDDDPETRRAIAAQEISDMAALPAFALADAAAAYRRGAIGDGKWRPTSGELIVEARRRANYFHVELEKLSRVLNAPVIAQATEYVLPERWAELSRMLAIVGVPAKPEISTEELVRVMNERPLEIGRALQKSLQEIFPPSA
jgi:hypothetical protein